MLEKHPLVRTIYLYLFTIIGLALMVSGSVRFLDMGLKMFIFTKADDQQKLQSYYSSPVVPVSSIEKLQNYQQSTSTELTAEEKAALKSWLVDYQKYQDQASKIDYLASQRQSDASSSLAMILVGLPLYLYHWRIIKKETKEEKQS
jgi:hypothetical protein